MACVLKSNGKSILTNGKYQGELYDRYIFTLAFVSFISIDFLRNEKIATNNMKTMMKRRAKKNTRLFYGWFPIANRTAMLTSIYIEIEITPT